MDAMLNELQRIKNKLRDEGDIKGAKVMALQILKHHQEEEMKSDTVLKWLNDNTKHKTPYHYPLNLQ